MTIENRLVLCYMFTDQYAYERTQQALHRLYRRYGNVVFLYQYGLRLADPQAPQLLQHCRVLALVVREDMLRTIPPVALDRMAGILDEEGAAYIAHVPGIITDWIGAMSEWQDGYLETRPRPPIGLVQVEPREERLIIAEVSDDGGETWRPMTEAERKEYA